MAVKIKKWGRNLPVAELRGLLDTGFMNRRRFRYGKN